ncbi:putative S-adenosylmethionine-dependent methyltransferase [Aspergillus clavatus NRRL 1]|uniref:Protein-lysine N-methyltransferase EFM4 n=1 Tax=Aspergillus clavatus (strain ATCC 1007 / CBS 513.65 / DSM 816 / NCTC 3887 / NRRL 1 / QM 1276 / 107) TaxID=344612 RepID=A1CF57_ASPCL|nr:S-adenosylmethionine-dependent methyltransferase, putative [Aspergillus clavatus NRRL 1]EAW11506.1 S-adenosylmethionine-dependent methyltransferase, putative [Aspergillus clavatus NRRL 1]
MADENHPTYLSPSELGTKDYWETYYARTLSHISGKRQPTTTTATGTADSSDPDSDSEDSIDDDDDPGTSWFSEHNAPTKVLDFLTSDAFPLAPCNTRPAADAQPSILDLGTGNGSMLALLRKRGGFKGVMVGVDYSARSVELARELQRLRIHSAYLSGSESEDEDEHDAEGVCEEGVGGGEKAEENPIRFEEWDILNAEAGLAERRVDWFPYGAGGFDIVLDKGTFDAVSLSEETVAAAGGEGEGETVTATAAGKVVQRRVCERYPGIARKLVRKGGFLVVTSCNWTEEELVRWFTSSEGEEGSAAAAAAAAAADRLVVWGRVEYPKFRFGGQEGQGVCTVCFQRVDS